MLLIINCDALSILFRHTWIYQHRVLSKRLRISSSSLFSILFHALSDGQCYDKHIQVSSRNTLLLILHYFIALDIMQFQYCQTSCNWPFIVSRHVHTIFRDFNFELKKINNWVVSDWNGWGVNFPIMIVSHIIHAMIIILIEMKPVVATYTLLS